MRWQDLVAKLTGRTPDAAAPAEGAAPPADAPASDPPPAPEREPDRASLPPEPEPEPAVTEPTEAEASEAEASEPPKNEPAAPEPAASVEANPMSEAQAQTKPTPTRPRHTRIDEVGRVYAQSLLEMAEAQGKVDEIADEADQIDELLRAQPGLRQMLETPAIGTDERRDLIDKVFKGRVSDTTWRFLQVVNAKGRAASLPGILAAFQQLLAEKRGIVEANITVAQRLEPDEAERVATRIGEAIGKRVVLHQFVDEKLIGGMVVRIGDRVIDGSVATQLRSMRRQLIDRGRERAQARGASE